MELKAATLEMFKLSHPSKHSHFGKKRRWMCTNLKANSRDCQHHGNTIGAMWMMMSLNSLTDHLVGLRTPLSDFSSLLLFLSSLGTELSSRAIFQPIYFLMWSNLGHLPLGRLYVVINDGYLAQVPGGHGAHLHNTDRYNTALQDQTGQDRPAADWRVADRCDECHCATTNHCFM